MITEFYSSDTRRNVQCASYGDLWDRSEILTYLQEEKSKRNAFSVLDVGASANPWTASVITTAFDRSPCSAAPISLLGDFNSHADWNNVLSYVAQNGRFSFAVCTHTLEDLAYPQLTLDMLPLVADAGFIAVPSKYHELSCIEGPYRGYIHHRWVFDANGDGLLLAPKISAIETFATNLEQPDWRDPARSELRFFWKGPLNYKILNDDFLGPDALSVAKLYVSFIGTR